MEATGEDVIDEHWLKRKEGMTDAAYAAFLEIRMKEIK